MFVNRLKKLAAAAVLAFGIAANAQGQATDLFFSEYVETNSGNNKALEIYNGTGAAVDLAAGVYTVERYANGTTTGTALSLSGTVADGDVYVIANNSGTNDPLLTGPADLLSSLITHNGDDAYSLKKNGVIIDVFGEIGWDPGTAWTASGGAPTSVDRTLRRKVDVCEGNAEGFADGTAGTTLNTVLADEWDEFPNLTYSGLGSHTANCAAATFDITVSAGPNGSITPTGPTVTVNSGDDQAFTITPDGGFQVADVLVNGVSVGAVTSYTFMNVTANQSISATFSNTTYTITASAGPNGQISPSGAVVVAEGGTQNFTFIPDLGFEVADVLVNGVSQGAITSFEFTNVMAIATISVSFQAATFDIVASAGAGGSISPSGTTNVAFGANQAYTITPDSGFVVADVLVDAVSVGAVTNYTFTNVQADATIAATFAPQTFDIVAGATVNGAIVPGGTTAVSEGSDLTLYIVPNPGFQVTDVVVDSLSVGAVDSFTFSNVTTNHTIDATFDVDPSGCPEPLIISEYIEGSSGNNKAIELYNTSDAAVNLAGYSLQLYSNGSPTVSRTLNLTLTGTTIAAGATLVLVNGAADQVAMLAAADFTCVFGDAFCPLIFNGDDTIGLFKNDVAVDLFGIIGNDPGTSWIDGAVDSANQTVTRNADICGGNPDGFVPLSLLSTEWTGAASQLGDALGSHTNTCTPCAGTVEGEGEGMAEGEGEGVAEGEGEGEPSGVIEVSASVGQTVCLTVPNPGTASNGDFVWTYSATSGAPGTIIPDESSATICFANVQVSATGFYTATFDDGAKAPQTVEFHLVVTEVTNLPALSVFGLGAAVLAIAVVGSRRRK